MANGGTLFLDEVTEMPPDLQVKFLRVLETRTFRRVGGSEELDMDIRLVASSNRDLAEAVRRETFRADLFYRLNVFPLRLPPLRERKEDVPLLATQLPRADRGEGAARLLVVRGAGARSALRPRLARERARAEERRPPGLRPERPARDRGRGGGGRPHRLGRRGAPAARRETRTAGPRSPSASARRSRPSRRGSSRRRFSP